jgi:5-methyltetrahydrofolate--homocysteine methyltransferase
VNGRLPLLSRLAAGDIVLADGATGTLLIERGLSPGRCPETINLEQPAVLSEIAAAYADAGAEIIQTNTFGGSPAKLAQYGLAERTAEINGVAVRAVRDAVGSNALICGSCGPSGRILEPYGDAQPAEIRASFLEQFEALLKAGVDLFSIETMTDLAEARLAVAAARSLAPERAIFATMTFDRTPRGFFTIMGTPVAEACAELTRAGADAVGSNCGNGSEIMIEICREFRRHTDRPIVARPNAGLPVMEDGRAVYPESPEFMAEKAEELIAAGVAVLGGCCGTTPAHTRALREMLDARQKTL